MQQKKSMGEHPFFCENPVQPKPQKRHRHILQQNGVGIDLLFVNGEKFPCGLFLLVEWWRHHELSCYVYIFFLSQQRWVHSASDQYLKSQQKRELSKPASEQLKVGDSSKKKNCNLEKYKIVRICETYPGKDKTERSFDIFTPQKIIIKRNYKVLAKLPYLPSVHKYVKAVALE